MPPTSSAESNRSDQAAHGASTARAWAVVALLVVSALINYVDRGNLSLAAPLIARQFTLSPVQIGALLAAFYWTYALVQLSGVAGWFTDRFPAGWVLFWGFFIWTGATALTGLGQGLISLFALRLLLGLGESVSYPCYSRIFAAMPQAQRGRANALIDAGTKLGPAGGAFLGGMLLAHSGWRMLFFAFGIGGLLWLAPWYLAMPRFHGPQPDRVEAQALSIGRLLRLKCAWGSFLGHFCGNYFFYFLLAWLPNYLVEEQHRSVQSMAGFAGGMYALIACSTIVAGWLSDRLIASGISPTRVRRAIAFGGLTLASTLAVFPLVQHSSILSMGLLAISCIGYGSYSSNHWAISQTLAGPAMAGRWTSLQNGVGNLSGIAAPWVAGVLLQSSGSLGLAFMLNGFVAGAGALLWGILVPRVEAVSWDEV